MKDQLISFETAKLAKDKGVPQSIKRGSSYLGGELICKYGFVDGILSENHFMAFTVGKEVAVAPTQSLLQRWLREEHKIISYVVPHTSSEIATISFCPVIALTKIAQLRPVLPTWEEALEVALYESLKLISCKPKI